MVLLFWTDHEMFGYPSFACQHFSTRPNVFRADLRPTSSRALVMVTMPLVASLLRFQLVRCGSLLVAGSAM